MFEAERRVERSEAYGWGGLALVVVVLGTIPFANLPAHAPASVRFLVYAPVLLIVGVAINAYRRRGKLVFRVVGDEKKFVMMRRWWSAWFHEDVTIQFSELTKVVYDSQSDSPVLTTFHLANGCIEHLGAELADHGPLLAYIRGAFPGEMTYDGKVITSPAEIPQRWPTKRTKRAGRRAKKRPSAKHRVRVSAVEKVDKP